MKEYQKLLFIFIIPFLLGSCKALEKKASEIKNRFQIKSTEEIIESKNSIEIRVSCGEDNDLEKYINEGWSILKEYSEEKICSWKSVAATKTCNMDKDKVM